MKTRNQREHVSVNAIFFLLGDERSRDEYWRAVCARACDGQFEPPWTLLMQVRSAELWRDKLELLDYPTCDTCRVILDAALEALKPFPFELPRFAEGEGLDIEPARLKVASTENTNDWNQDEG